MAVDDPLLNKKLGDYTIQKLLGRGGMSRVYRGYDENLDRHAAVKVISGDFVTTTEEEYTRRFQSEARSIARLRHPNIVGIYQFGRTEGIYYMAQVYLEGKDLRSLLKEYGERHQRIPPEEVLRITRDVAAALDYAHEQGVIHRDIKPSNIMLEKKTGRAILMDFGLALSVQEGTMGDTFGSAHYIAPEQAVSSAKAVPQSDLYSLGIVLYEMLAGRVPFDDPSVMSVALKHLNELPPPPTMYNPDLPPAVERVIMRVLDKDPTRRHATGGELVADLERAFRIDRPGDAPDARSAPAVLDMLDSRTKPPAPWWQSQAGESEPPSEHPRPSAALTAKMREQEESGVSGLAKRFARRREQKEEQAALQSVTEENLQLDNAALESLLDSMPDPSDIGLVGEGARGVTRPDRPSDLSRPSMPRAAGGTERRSRLTLLLPVLLVLGILAGGLYFGGQLGGGGGDDDGDKTPTATLPSRDRTATAVMAAALALSQTPDATLEPTRQATDAPTKQATAQPTQAPDETSAPTITPELTEAASPTQAPTREPTITREPTQAASPTTAPTQAPTDTPEPTEAASPTQEPTATAEPSPTDTPTVEPTAAQEPNVRLMYNRDNFVLINISSKTIDISALVFKQDLPSGAERTFLAAEWDEPPGLVGETNALRPGGCYELVTSEGSWVRPSSADCAAFLGWFRSNVSDRYFWLSNRTDATFTVQLSGSDTPLATCTTSPGECSFYLPPAEE
jgi:serine/threonine protein kinase